MRSAMRTAVRTGMKYYVVEKADTSILFCGSQFQPGLLHARELAPHGGVRCVSDIADLFLDGGNHRLSLSYSEYGME